MPASSQTTVDRMGTIDIDRPRDDEERMVSARDPLLALGWLFLLRRDRAPRPVPLHRHARSRRNRRNRTPSTRRRLRSAHTGKARSLAAFLVMGPSTTSYLSASLFGAKRRHPAATSSRVDWTSTQACCVEPVIHREIDYAGVRLTKG